MFLFFFQTKFAALRYNLVNSWQPCHVFSITVYQSDKALNIFQWLNCLDSTVQKTCHGSVFFFFFYFSFAAVLSYTVVYEHLLILSGAYSRNQISQHTHGAAPIEVFLLSPCRDGGAEPLCRISRRNKKRNCIF